MARKKKEEIEEKKEEITKDNSTVEKPTTLGLLQKLGYAVGDTVDLATLNKLAKK